MSQVEVKKLELSPGGSVQWLVRLRGDVDTFSVYLSWDDMVELQRQLWRYMNLGEKAGEVSNASE